jgi:hypothetical protein
MDRHLTLTIVSVLAGAAVVAGAPVLGATLITYEVRPIGHQLLNYVRAFHLSGETHLPSVDR